MKIDQSKTMAQLLAELELLQRRVVLLEASDARRKEQFLANISHELRTPLNGVLGMLGLLLDSQLTPDQKEFAQMARDSALLLMDTVTNLLNFATLDIGARPLESIHFDLRSTLEGLLELFAVRAREKGLIFVTEVSGQVPFLLCGDPEGLRQILSCIVGNALKFTAHGSINLEVTQIGTTTKNEVLLKFLVSDTGIGIPAHMLDTLFEPFTQADGSSTRRYGGTGIGLAIARQLVNSMGGDIQVTSEEGKGSRFSLTLPFTPQPESRPPLSEPLISLSPQDWHILVVEDANSNRRLLKILLENWGCRCEEAEDAFVALEKLQTALAKKDPFHIALLDMVLPGMDGETLGSVIKQDDSLKNTTLVMLTSMGKRGDAQRLEKIGFSAYFTKPVDTQQLHGCLTTLMANLTPSHTPRTTELITRYSVDEARRRQEKG